MKQRSTAPLWIGLGILTLALLFSVTLFAEYAWLSVAIGVAWAGNLAWLAKENQKALRTRTAAFGIHSLVTAVLVISILGVVNFLAARYPGKLDLTKNKKHTLSDQTVKVIKGLQKPVKAVYFAKMNQREQVRPLLDNLKGLSPKFEVEYVDPDKEPTRARQVGIKKYGTLQLLAGTGTSVRESKVEDATEEKVTNALIKLLKEKPQTLCAISGHGERSFMSAEADGYELARKALGDQSYEIKEVSLPQESKIPATCDAIAILGPSKAFFEQEVKAIQDYLAAGGRAIIGIDVNAKGTETSPELKRVLETWYVKAGQALIVDPVSRMVGVDAAVPILATFSKENAITKEFQGNCYFPFTRPLDIMPGAPGSLTVQWLAQTTPNSWGETDFGSLGRGQVSFDEGKDRKGPLNAAIAVQGKLKDSQAPRNTRIVVFGTSLFATNNYSRFGGNLDLFLNSVSWVLEDESLISIRAKEDVAGKIEVSPKQDIFITLLTLLLIPGGVILAGVIVWVYRRRL